MISPTIAYGWISSTLMERGTCLLSNTVWRWFSVASSPTVYAQDERSVKIWSSEASSPYCKLRVVVHTQPTGFNEASRVLFVRVFFRDLLSKLTQNVRACSKRFTLWFFSSAALFTPHPHPPRTQYNVTTSRLGKHVKNIDRHLVAHKFICSNFPKTLSPEV